MRTMLVLAACLALLAGVFGQHADSSTAQAQPEPTAVPSVTPEPSGTPDGTATSGATQPPTALPTSQLETPIVDPEPVPGRVFLPRVIRGEDAALPPPVVAGDVGFLHSLTERGREACAPATHVLLEKREGAVDNRAIAVLENRMEDLELDFYIGEYVDVKGIESMSAEACRRDTSRHIGVVLIRRVPRPPGS